MVSKLRILVVIATVVVSGIVMSQSAFAQSNSNNRPGWGNGDKNHHHSGPPGHSVHPEDGDNHGHHRFFHFWDFWKYWLQHNRH